MRLRAIYFLTYDMNKIVIAKGVFDLSREAKKWLEDHGWKGSYFGGRPVIQRHDPLLIQCIEALGENAILWDDTELAIVEIPGNKYRIRFDNELAEDILETPETIEWTEIK